MLDGLAEERSEFLVVEDLEGAAGRNFADCRGVKSMVVVAVAGLHEDGGVAQALGVHLPAHVVQVYTLACNNQRYLRKDSGVARRTPSRPCLK